MRTRGLIFASQKMIAKIQEDQASSRWPTWPSCRASWDASAMPDIHWGYGFCIGGVCGDRSGRGGVISPGGVGYDINCGVRLMRTNLTASEDVQPRNRLMDALCFAAFPPASARAAVSVRRQGAAPACWPRAPPIWSTRGWATRRATSNTPRPAAASPAPIPTPSAERALRARRRPVRHARLRQPLSRSAGRRRDLRRSRPPQAMGLRRSRWSA